ncbi:Endosomal peripheral membrane protein [Aspergillus sclerotialis]|uniref:Endosomal peripheral membrane protein n=1 Tax=Aspergillus sclerotialis TaxID=2070753 RepID=A0A3A2ZEF4_9EURO|nr:Endosomal peripheral membrane protein [Aspergillus sclerotialis]
MALGLLIHLLEPDGTPWKRVLCMEIFRALYAEPGLVRLIYSLYDGQEGRKTVLKDHMATLVRLASEKPSLIGVSNQSTVPSRHEHSRSMTEDQITLEVGGVAGVIGTSVPTTEPNVSGISNQWSVVRIPYVELLDKSDAPTPPDTYIYGLALNCISNLAEGLAKFILPLTVPDFKSRRKNRVTGPEQVPHSIRDSQELQHADSSRNTQNSNSKKSPIPINPLELESHPQLLAIRSCAGIIENCWPAILATCSTFLYASLDDEFYHHLVRSFQKLAHVAGLLRLSVPRDAFLTTLGKSAIPAGFGGRKASTTPTGDPHNSSPTEKKLHTADKPDVSSPQSIDPTSTLSENSKISLSTRNLLCMRALLNLGIALGPTLDLPAWSIILETLQHTDLMVGLSSAPSAKSSMATSNSGDTVNSGAEVPKVNLGAEIVAVQAAASKMLESTSDYPCASYEKVLLALLNLSAVTARTIQHDLSEDVPGPPSSPQSQRRAGHMHQNARRLSLTVGKSKMAEEELRFVLQTMNELSKANLGRLSSLDENDHSAWRFMTDSLISSTASEGISAALRLNASEILNDIIFRTMKQKSGDDDSARSSRQLRNLQTLRAQIRSLYDAKPSLPGSFTASLIDIHEQCLDNLKNILEQYGETFSEGWTHVFSIISSVFYDSDLDENAKQFSPGDVKKTLLLSDSPRLVRAAYKSLQLIVSDFLVQLPSSCRLELVDSFSKFASQQQDFNISLTTTSFFWTVSDFLQGQIERFSIESHVDASVSEEVLGTLAKDSDPSVSRNSLWLLLLLRIVDVTTDSRSEVRNSAVHTLLRIFDAYGQQLAPKAWRLCLNRVLFRMVDEIAAKLLKYANGDYSANTDEFKSWTETTVVMVKGSSELITNFFESIVQDEEFDRSWERLLKSFHTLISLRRLEFSEATFSSLSNILLRVRSAGSLSNGALQSAWLLWTDGHPASKAELIDLEQSNQEASLAYLRAFQQIYRLYSGALTVEHVDQILQNMRLLAWNSVSPPYSPDNDRPSNLQTLIIDCMETICSEKHESQPSILLCLADYVDSALSKWTPKDDPRRPTFVAFSKNAIDLLSWYIADFGIKNDVFTNGSLTTALEHLATPITGKYEWQGKDRERNLWQKATTASINIIQVAIPYVEEFYTKSRQSDISRFWECVVDIAQGIVSASGHQILRLPNTSILADESFDITAFKRLKSLIIPSLGASAIPDTIRRDFACALFYSSFIYAPQRFDLPSTPLEKDPLKGIYDVRAGRTFDPPPTLRPNMAYVLIDTMFELASIPPFESTKSDKKDQTLSNGSALISLARSISPYLILRCAVSLKTYIADQPLRGLMPQPTPARKALLHLLRGMVELQSEPSAIPESPGIKILPASSDSTVAGDSHHRKHLEWIYPLVVKAVQVAGKERDDGQVLQALGKVLEKVGNSV